MPTQPEAVHAAMCAVLIAMGPSVALSANPCSVDRRVLLALSPEKFDQDMDAGWRAVEQKEGCRRVAADLIADYRAAHWGHLSPAELQANLWHEGQLRAAVGDNSRAISLLLAGVPAGDDKADFVDYALGTVAFLQRDLSALKSARQRLAKVPEPAWFAKERQETMAQYGAAPTWPVNLEVLDKLIACWDKPYAAAYQSDDCKPSP
jgi:hypothetical protein